VSESQPDIPLDSPSGEKSEPSCEKIHARVSFGAALMAVSTILSRCKSMHVIAVFAVANPF